MGLFRSSNAKTCLPSNVGEDSDAAGHDSFFPSLIQWNEAGFFQPARGIHQGDPISPYLFLFAAEGLSCLLKNRIESSMLHGIKVTPSAPMVNHMLFADDCLLLFKVDG